MRKLFLVASISLASSVLVTGCSTSSTTGGPGLFSGSTKQATITKGNAKSFLVTSASTQKQASTANIFAGMHKSPQKLLEKLGSRATTSTTDPNKIHTNGECGGTMDFVMQAGATQNSMNMKVTFDNYCTWFNEAEKTKEIANGFMNFTGEGESTFAISLDISTKSPEEDSKVVGEMTMKSTSADNFEIAMTMEFSDAISKETGKIENFKLAMNGNAMTISGRVYDDEFGYVDIETVKAVKADSNGIPTEGEILVTANKSSARITYSGPNYTIAIDEDGDGKVDSTESGLSSEFAMTDM